MGLARAQLVVPRPLAAVERGWYDLDAWPLFVDGFARVAAVAGPWPEAGATLTWDSVPRGRGRVVERVVAYEPGAGQESAVQDDQLRGTQRVAFEPLGDETRVALTLDYRLAAGGPLRVPLDLLFVRRALVESLERTLARFEHELLG